MAGQAWIELFRANHGYVDRTTPAVLLIDDAESGSVLPNESLRVEVSPGRHRVQVGTFDAWSKPLEIVADAGSVVGLKMSAWPGAAWLNPLLLGRSIHYRLRKTDATSAP